MIVTVCKTSFQKSNSKEIFYRNYKNFDINTFKNVLRLKLQSIKSYESFEQVYLEVLNKDASLKKKFLRANHVPTINDKAKTIVRRSELESKYLKNRTIESKAKYKKQNNFCSKLYKKKRKKFYSNLELNEITDNKRLWKPLLSDKCIQSSTITLINNEMLSLMTLNKQKSSIITLKRR